MKIVPVILLGGSGSRLWPVSRKNYPKQFLTLIGDQTMLQTTLSRLQGIDGLDSTIVVCNENHRFTTAEQLHEIGHDLGDIILEPMGKNTAPAVVIAALRALQKQEDVLLLVLPADHLIADIAAFQAAVAKATDVAKDDHLVTFGIVPDKAETGYGYVKRGDVLTDGIYHVDQFVEKPDLATAESYLQSGDFYWNSGMFLFKASVFLAEVERFVPQMLTSCQAALDDATHDLDFIRLGEEAFSSCPSDSIDYAVMEKTQNAVTVPLDAGWNDVGTWDALWDVADKDENKNVLTGDVLTHDSHHCMVRAENKLVALIGVDNLVVIETKDAVLVAS